MLTYNDHNLVAELLIYQLYVIAVLIMYMPASRQEYNKMQQFIWRRVWSRMLKHGTELEYNLYELDEDPTNGLGPEVPRLPLIVLSLDTFTYPLLPQTFHAFYVASCGSCVVQQTGSVRYEGRTGKVGGRLQCWCWVLPCATLIPLIHIRHSHTTHSHVAVMPNLHVAHGYTGDSCIAEASPAPRPAPLHVCKNRCATTTPWTHSPFPDAAAALAHLLVDPLFPKHQSPANRNSRWRITERRVSFQNHVTQSFQ